MLAILLDHSLALLSTFSTSRSSQKRAPTKAPILVPATMSMGTPEHGIVSRYTYACWTTLVKGYQLNIPASARALRAPIWAMPRAPPPPNTRPTEVPVSLRASLAQSECLSTSSIFCANKNNKAKVIYIRWILFYLQLLEKRNIIQDNAPKNNLQWLTTENYYYSVAYMKVWRQPSQSIQPFEGTWRVHYTFSMHQY